MLVHSTFSLPCHVEIEGRNVMYCKHNITNVNLLGTPKISLLFCETTTSPMSMLLAMKNAELTE